MATLTSERGYPIGQQDFKILRSGHSIYVDKTMYIEKLLRQESRYYFLARPRRFGKSLFLSTLRYFFEGERDLFRGLYIDKTAWEWEKYPVLYLDLNTDRYADPGQLEPVLESLFCKWEKRYDVHNDYKDYSQRFKAIIEGAYLKTGRGVVILVDEYDKPLVGNINRDDHFEHYRAKLASLYSNLKSSAEYIKLVFLTGVSRFSKLSVFSDLNNLSDISFEEDFADICGITECELHAYFQKGIALLAEKNGIDSQEAVRLLKRNYDGYRFAPGGSDIYNPWSLLNCLQYNRIGNFWNMTGMPTLIAETLKNLDVDLESVLNTECEPSTLLGLDLCSPDPVALLYQTGYLTIKNYNREVDLLTLGVPNKEVTDGLFKVLLPYYIEVRKGAVEMVVRNIINDILLGRPRQFIRNLDIFFSGIPYEMKMDNENNVHNALYILLTLIGVKTDTEVHTSNGRIDLVIKTKGFIYIVELKFDHDSTAAMAQIDEKDYARPYLADPRRIFLIGANFSSRTRCLDAPVIRELEK